MLRKESQLDPVNLYEGCKNRKSVKCRLAPRRHLGFFLNLFILSLFLLKKIGRLVPPKAA